MNVVEFDVDTVKIRFEAPKGALVQGKSDDGKPTLLAKAASTLEEAATATGKLVEIFSKNLISPDIESVEIALGIKLEGQTGFLFVNSKAEAAITVTATMKPKKK
ncbi:CU044_2847 family protein [Methylomonas methanica]|uniref:Trypsin-co-occurring domain-containing protein n=1 Tax=Methylomonas methanica TaxID=421 RepID=A0A177MH37_METMH|nr:CU044_2847 family protein [Methylomonas methanica]OAI04774.1 hypothetical protein A1332_14070 [Methylomonas methanica]